MSLWAVRGCRMSRDKKRRVVRLNYAHGLHARPATFIVQELSKFDARIYLLKDNRCVNAKSVIELLTLGAMDGERLAIEAEGADADKAVERLAWLLECGLREQFQEK